MKISEQARNATVKELESNYDRATGKTKFQIGEHIQLLLNSEREKIIKELEIPCGNSNLVWTCDFDFLQAVASDIENEDTSVSLEDIDDIIKSLVARKKAILAKLKE